MRYTNFQYNYPTYCNPKIYQPFCPQLCWLGIIVVFILVLLVLGCIKGLIGLLYCTCIGEFGLNTLIDLPRPLPQYQEPSIACREVVYDEAGWPVHPDTGRRNVRVLSRNTEFLLNVIFFVAYPLAMIMKLIEMTCCIRNYSKSDENLTYKQVNVIKMMEGRVCKCRGSALKFSASKEKCAPIMCPPADIYYEDDGKEERDTEYVVEILRESKSSLQETFCGFH